MKRGFGVDQTVLLVRCSGSVVLIVQAWNSLLIT